MSLSNKITQGYIRTVLNIKDDDTIKVIRANQGGQSPSKPYITYMYLGNQSIGAAPQTSHTETATELFENIDTNRTPVLEVQFFTKTEAEAIKESIEDYETANELCQRFEDNLKSDRVKRYMRENGFSVLSANTTFNLDSFLGDVWERRSVIELNMNDVSSVSNEVEFFTPPVTLTIEPEDI